MARLPPFIALRALEAAVRHRSYSRAADELSVTHGAVSHQIRRLEDELKATLFVRRGNLMEPTPDALALAAKVAETLRLLQEAMDQIARRAASGPLVISTFSSFATRWLSPNLARLAEETGEPELELRVSDEVADLVTDGVDMAIRFGLGGWPDVSAMKLLSETLFPVCSPAFAERHGLKAPEDLYRVPLLKVNERPWSIWFEAVGLAPPPASRGLVFDDSAALLEAAARGLGAALARSSLVEHDLKEGRLVRPFRGEAPAKAGLFVVWRDDSPKLKRVLRLRDWLIAEGSAGASGA